jgi:hypothetical protein
MQGPMGPLSEADSGDQAHVSPYASTVAAHYDRACPLPAGLAELATEMDDIIARCWPLGMPLWLPVAFSAYAALISGEEKSLFCALMWDASPDGLASLARCWTLSGIPSSTSCSGGRLLAGRVGRR